MSATRVGFAWDVFGDAGKTSLRGRLLQFSMILPTWEEYLGHQRRRFRTVALPSTNSTGSSPQVLVLPLADTGRRGHIHSRIIADYGTKELHIASHVGF